VILNTIGAEDYGIYNVVAGVVTMFSFLSSSMAYASQRYFSFEIGRGDLEQLKKIFSLSFTIYVLIGLLVILLAETVGLWFVDNKLIIPSGRKFAALGIYQCAIFSFLMMMITTPFMATIIAHENMSIYAYISIAEVILKLISVYVLQLISADKLLVYGFLILIVGFINTGIYRFVCIKKYTECRFRFYWNFSLFKELSSYVGWNLFGSIASLFKNQGITILLNIFFTPVISAARSISLQMSSVVQNFALNFTTAMYPQIIKRYALNNHKEMLSLVYRSSRYTFYLIYLVSLPLLIQMPYVLNMWLKIVPEYTVLFARLSIIDILIEAVSIPVATAKQATGEIKIYQIILGITIFLNLPVSYVILRMGYPAYMVLVISIILTILAVAIRVFFLKTLRIFSIVHFLKRVYLPIGLVVVPSVILLILLSKVQTMTFFNFILFFLESVFGILLLIYIAGLTGDERQMVKSFIYRKIIKKRSL
jgi:O-antigen/teichoic acid export membrane protein